jgi:hypothetical protein
MNRAIPQVALRFNVAPLDRDPMQEALRKQLRLLASLLQFRQVPGTQHYVIDRQEIVAAMRDLQQVIESA